MKTLDYDSFLEIIYGDKIDRTGKTEILEKPEKTVKFNRVEKTNIIKKPVSKESHKLAKRSTISNPQEGGPQIKKSVMKAAKGKKTKKSNL